jgi:hypothetical protein
MSVGRSSSAQAQHSTAHDLLQGSNPAGSGRPPKPHSALSGLEVTDTVYVFTAAVPCI